MKKNLKENISLILSAGGFIFGLLSVIGWLGVSPESVGQGMYDFLLVALPIIVFASGALVGTSLFNIWTNRKLGMTLEEAVEKLDEYKRKEREAEEAKGIEDSERQFRTMSFEAKGLCYVPAKDGVREISGEDDLQTDYGADDWREAEDAGFILIERCGTHQHRIRATKKLLDLVRAKPEILDEVEYDFAKDFTENFVIQQTMDDDGRMSPPKIVDRFTGEESNRWTIGGKKR